MTGSLKTNLPMLLAKSRHDIRDVSLRDVNLRDVNLRDLSLRDLSLRDLSLREFEPQRKGYMSFRGRAKRSYSVPNPGGFLDWLLFKSGIRKPTRLRAKGKNQAGEEGNTIDLRRLLPLLRRPGTLNQIRNSGERRTSKKVAVSTQDSSEALALLSCNSKTPVP
jgi:hypothetical protein